MSEAVSQTLVWVNEELASTFQEARQALEEYIERPEQSAALQRCAERMHEANGALMMVEVQGAALLAEEVELVVRRLLEETPNTPVLAHGPSPARISGTGFLQKKPRWNQ